LAVVRIEPRESTDPIRHSVDHNERAVVVQGVVSPDPDGGVVVPGLSAPIDRHYSGQLPGDGVRQIDRGDGLQLPALDRADGTRERRLSLLAVSDGHDLLQTKATLTGSVKIGRAHV